MTRDASADSAPTAQLTAADISFGPLSQPAPFAVARLTGRGDSGPALSDEVVRTAGLYGLNALSSADDVEAALRRLATAIHGADGLKVETIRRRALTVLDQVGVRAPGRLVDAALATRGNGSPERAANGEALRLESPEPWPTAVELAPLLDTTATLIQEHIILSAPQADLVSLWVAAAYAIDALSLMPILLVSSATMRSGKSRLLSLLCAVTPRALLTSNVTGAVLARTLAKYQPTLLCDEADTWLSDDNAELRGIINAGHTRATAYILRCAPETHEPMLLPCFAARAIAMIRKPSPTILDRSVIVQLRRKHASELVKPLREDRLHGAHRDLRCQFQRWAVDAAAAIKDVDPELPIGLNDRAIDNARPLVGIGDLAGGTWPDRARRAALIGTARDLEDEGRAAELLRDVQVVFKAEARRWLSSAALTAGLVALPDSPWAELRGGRALSPVRLAAMLRPFGVRTMKVRDGGQTFNAYERAALDDLFARYVPGESEQSEPANESGPRSDLFNSEQNACVPSQKTRNNIMNPAPVPTVPSCIGGLEEERGQRERF